MSSNSKRIPSTWPECQAGQKRAATETAPKIAPKRGAFTTALGKLAPSTKAAARLVKSPTKGTGSKSVKSGPTKTGSSSSPHSTPKKTASNVGTSKAPIITADNASVALAPLACVTARKGKTAPRIVTTRTSVSGSDPTFSTYVTVELASHDNVPVIRIRNDKATDVGEFILRYGIVLADNTCIESHFIQVDENNEHTQALSMHLKRDTLIVLFTGDDKPASKTSHFEAVYEMVTAMDSNTDVRFARLTNPDIQPYAPGSDFFNFETVEDDLSWMYVCTEYGQLLVQTAIESVNVGIAGVKTRSNATCVVRSSDKDARLHKAQSNVKGAPTKVRTSRFTMSQKQLPASSVDCLPANLTVTVHNPFHVPLIRIKLGNTTSSTRTVELQYGIECMDGTIVQSDFIEEDYDDGRSLSNKTENLVSDTLILLFTGVNCPNVNNPSPAFAQVVAHIKSMENFKMIHLRLARLSSDEMKGYVPGSGFFDAETAAKDIVSINVYDKNGNVVATAISDVTEVVESPPSVVNHGDEPPSPVPVTTVSTDAGKSVETTRSAVDDGDETSPTSPVPGTTEQNAASAVDDGDEPSPVPASTEQNAATLVPAPKPILSGNAENTAATNTNKRKRPQPSGQGSRVSKRQEDHRRHEYFMKGNKFLRSVRPIVLRATHGSRPTIREIEGYCFSSFVSFDATAQFIIEFVVFALMTRDGVTPTMETALSLLKHFCYSLVHEEDAEYREMFKSFKYVRGTLIDHPTNPFLRTNPKFFANTLHDLPRDVRYAWSMGDVHDTYVDIDVDDSMFFALMKAVATSPHLSPLVPNLTHVYVIVIEFQSPSFWNGYEHSADSTEIDKILCLNIETQEHVTYTSTGAIRHHLDIISGSKSRCVYLTDRRAAGMATWDIDDLPFEMGIKVFTDPFWRYTPLRTRDSHPSEVEGQIILQVVRIPKVDVAPIMKVITDSSTTRALDGRAASPTYKDIVNITGRQPLEPSELMRYRAEQYKGRCMSSLPLVALANLVTTVLVALKQSPPTEDFVPWWLVMSKNVGLPMARALMATACLRLHAIIRVHDKLQTLEDEIQWEDTTVFEYMTASFLSTVKWSKRTIVVAPPHANAWQGPRFSYENSSRTYHVMAKATMDYVAAHAPQVDAGDGDAEKNVNRTCDNYMDWETVRRLEVNSRTTHWWDEDLELPRLQTIAHADEDLKTAVTSGEQGGSIVLGGVLAIIQADRLPASFIASCRNVNTKSTILKNARYELNAQIGMTCLSAFAVFIFCTTDSAWLASLNAALSEEGAAKTRRVGEEGVGPEHLGRKSMPETHWVGALIDSFVTAIQQSDCVNDEKSLKAYLRTFLWTMVLLRPHAVTTLIRSRIPHINCNKLPVPQQIALNRFQRGAIFTVNYVIRLAYLRGGSARDAIYIIRDICVFMNQPKLTWDTANRDIDERNSYVRKPKHFIYKLGLVHEGHDRSIMYHHQVPIKASRLAKLRNESTNRNEECKGKSPTDIGVCPADPIPDKLASILYTAVPTLSDDVLRLMRALTTRIRTKKEVKQKKLGSHDTTVHADAIREEFLSEPCDEDVTQIKNQYGGKAAKDRRDEFRRTPPRYAYTRNGFEADLRARGCVCIACGTPLTELGAIKCTGSTNRHVLCEHRCCANARCCSNAMLVFATLYEPTDKRDDRAHNVWGWIESHRFELPSAPPPRLASKSKPRQKPNKQQSVVTPVASTFTPTLRSVLTLHNTVNVDVDEETTADGTRDAEPRVYELVHTKSSVVKVPTDVGWFPYAPGTYEIDIENDLEDVKHGTITLGVMGVAFQDTTAQLVKLSLAYRDGQDAKFGRWPKHQLVRLQTFEWDFDTDGTLRRTMRFLIQIASASTMEGLFRGYAKRCGIGWFSTKKQALAGIHDSGAEAAIRRSMTECVGVPNINLSSIHDDDDESYVLAAGTVDMSAATLRALGEGKRDEEVATVHEDEEEAAHLSQLYEGIRNLLYKTMDSTVLEGDRRGENRCIWVQVGADRCLPIPFNGMFRILHPEWTSTTLFDHQMQITNNRSSVDMDVPPSRSQSPDEYNLALCDIVRKTFTFPVLVASQGLFRRGTTQPPNSPKQWLLQPGSSNPEGRILISTWNPNNSHWLCIVVTFPESKIFVLDSWPGQHCVYSEEIRNRAIERLGLSADTRLFSYPTEKQVDTNSCGIFAHANAECVVRGSLPSEMNKLDSVPKLMLYRALIVMRMCDKGKDTALALRRMYKLDSPCNPALLNVSAWADSMERDSEEYVSASEVDDPDVTLCTLDTTIDEEVISDRNSGIPATEATNFGMDVDNVGNVDGDTDDRNQSAATNIVASKGKDDAVAIVAHTHETAKNKKRPSRTSVELVPIYDSSANVASDEEVQTFEACQRCGDNFHRNAIRIPCVVCGSLTHCFRCLRADKSHKLQICMDCNSTRSNATNANSKTTDATTDASTVVISDITANATTIATSVGKLSRTTSTHNAGSMANVPTVDTNDTPIPDPTHTTTADTIATTTPEGNNAKATTSDDTPPPPKQRP